MGDLSLSVPLTYLFTTTLSAEENKESLEIVLEER
jgi:hypothetical protein